MKLNVGGLYKPLSAIKHDKNRYYTRSKPYGKRAREEKKKPGPNREDAAVVKWKAVAGLCTLAHFERWHIF